MTSCWYQTRGQKGREHSVSKFPIVGRETPAATEGAPGGFRGGGSEVGETSGEVFLLNIGGSCGCGGWSRLWALSRGLGKALDMITHQISVDFGPPTFASEC